MDSVIAIKNASTSCKTNHKDPLGGDCTIDTINAIKSVFMNAVTLIVGWYAPGAVNGVMIDGQHKRSIDQEECEASFLSNINSAQSFINGSPFFNSISSWAAIFPCSNITGKTLLKRGTPPVDQMRYFDETTNAWVTLNHVQKNASCGSLPMSKYSMSNINITLQKREYSLYPLCSGYYGVDYCANHNKWGGICASGELANQIDQIVKNDITSSWMADYYKLYTYEQDGSTEDWQLSFRVYYADAPLSTFHWTKCDTSS